MYVYQVCGAAMQGEWRAEEERRAAQELEEVKQQRRLMEFKVQELSYFMGGCSCCRSLLVRSCSHYQIRCRCIYFWLMEVKTLHFYFTWFWYEYLCAGLWQVQFYV